MTIRWDRQPNQISVDSLWSDFRNKRIELHPVYQRDLVWSKRMNQYLIWCMLRNRDINHFYFHARQERKRFWYDVVDGQQRLHAIFSFLNDEFSLARWPNFKHRTVKEQDGYIGDVKVAGKKFSDLPDEQRKQLLLYQIHSTVIDSNDTQDVIEQFVDLQSNKVLTPQQVREAYPSPLNTAIHMLEQHPMIKRVSFTSGRWGASSRLMLARMFYCERERQLTGTNVTMLTRFYLSSRFSTIPAKQVDEMAEMVKATLDIMYAIFGDQPPIMYSTEGYLLYWLIRMLPLEGIQPRRFAGKLSDWRKHADLTSALSRYATRKLADHTSHLLAAYEDVHTSFLRSIRRVEPSVPRVNVPAELGI